MPKHLFDEGRFADEFAGWIKQYPELPKQVAQLLDAEIERNVREALGKVELPSEPALTPPRPMTESEINLLRFGWGAARVIVREKIDAMVKEYSTDSPAVSQI